jgi:hypothetical protein
VKPHATDWLSLVFGLIFVGAASLWLTSQLVSLRPATVGWILASGLVLLGGFGLVQALTAGRRHADRDGS